MSGGDFILRVKKITDALTAQHFFNWQVANLQRTQPEVKDPEARVRADIGWCFGEGMAVEQRRMWRAVCGAEHPVAGPEYTERNFSPEELMAAGGSVAEQRMHERDHPSAWSLVLRDRFED